LIRHIFRSPFSFNSLNASDTTAAVNEPVTLSANATGAKLIFHCSSSYGTFSGSGAMVKWFVCHADKFIVTCDVLDGNGNFARKQTRIYIQEAAEPMKMWLSDFLTKISAVLPSVIRSPNDLPSLYDTPVYKNYNGKQLTPKNPFAVSVSRDFNLNRIKPKVAIETLFQ
jgi:hypothetical protein